MYIIIYTQLIFVKFSTLYMLGTNLDCNCHVFRFISDIEAVCRQWLADGPKNLLVCLKKLVLLLKLLCEWVIHVSLCILIATYIFALLSLIFIAIVMKIVIRSCWEEKFLVFVVLCHVCHCQYGFCVLFGCRKRMQGRFRRIYTRSSLSWSFQQKLIAWNTILEQNMTVMRNFNRHFSLIIFLS